MRGFCVPPRGRGAEAADFEPELRLLEVASELVGINDALCALAVTLATKSEGRTSKLNNGWSTMIVRPSLRAILAVSRAAARNRSRSALSGMVFACSQRHSQKT